MPRRNWTSTPALANPNLTPLLDIVLQLITFFMMLVHFGSRLEGSTKLIRLPLVPAALPGSDLTFDRLVAVLDAQGRLRVGGQTLDDSAASDWWAQQAKLRRSGARDARAPRRRRRRLADDRDPPGRPVRLLWRGPPSPGSRPGEGFRPFQPGRPQGARDEYGGRSGDGAESYPGPRPIRHRPDRRHRSRPAPVAAIPARPARRGLVPRDADARHGLPAPGLLHPDLQAPSAETHIDLDLPATPAALPFGLRRPAAAPTVPEG